MNTKLGISWQELLSGELEKKYFKNIQAFLTSEEQAGKIIFPQQENIFAAFNTTPVDNIKVVILGQDPYHGAWQAHWLSFSVQDGVKTPPSLRNIYKELKLEYPDYEIPESGDLIHWAQQWILLLNSILTVEVSKPASHSKIGWEEFTDSVIQKISDSQQWIIFVLWGKFAQTKKVLINTNKHFVLESSHPSPFSAHRGFLGSGHFKEVNNILKSQGKAEITW